MTPRRVQLGMAVVLAVATVDLALLDAPVFAILTAIAAAAQFAAFLVAPRGRGVVTVLFLDAVSSTEAISTLGDAAWEMRFGAFRDAARRELGRVPAVVVKDLGDGLLAAFPLVVVSPTKVVDAARRIRDDARSRGVDIRAGIHAGECSMSRRDVRGLAVHLASRIADSAEPGQVLVSGTVRELVAGSDVQLRALGERTFKGVTDPLRIFVVDSDTRTPGD